jgi:glycosyltransferase involved in cell wall biosynthesis
MVSAYIRRLRRLLSQSKFDLLWIEYELFPWLPAWFEVALARAGVRYVVEYDDAIFHRYDRHRARAVRLLLGSKVDVVMRHATAVVAGNEYLAARARQAGAHRVEIIPSVIDLNRYVTVTKGVDDTFTVGWIGSPTSARYLNEISGVLRTFHGMGNVRLVFVGAGRNVAATVPAHIVEWSEQSEVGIVQGFDVGIMPLSDGAWERGKCGYKLIQYMACGKPVVASRVGSNAEIVIDGETGFLVSDANSWLGALEKLMRDAALGSHLGTAGRRRVEQTYSLQVTAPRWVRLLEQLAP